ncbi:molybdate-anion transporter-like [Centruroides sculpturatus]|uniref:molybdate-anion transporter-like n=1 Tax=Centruroides sculpturatus TaxID=218467 RepID=UPI000C6DCD6F|nr:molybdate-anion transporter-like [Centruroides sculpturatus]
MSPINESNFDVNITTDDGEWMTSTTYVFLIVLSAWCFVLYYTTRDARKRQSSSKNDNFVRFQKQYFAAYFPALFGDWLQGPYVYKLYSHYGFAESQIAALYIVGFGTSMLLGTCVGTLADRFGRRRMCVTFGILYSACCLTKLSSHYFLLMFGRFLGGISTSLLFSAFESWYVYQHVQSHDFPREWISLTFSEATFWNGVLAIGAGIAADGVSEAAGWGPAAPFVVAVPFLLGSSAAVYATWEENYGERKNPSSWGWGGLSRIVRDRRILLLGLVQSTFESVVYIFVFLWTPVLDAGNPPLGLVFSVFMTCIMVGSLLYQLSASRGVPAHVPLALSLLVAWASVTLCVFSTGPSDPAPFVSYLSFLGLELAVGVYFPSVGFLKSRLIPESNRANIMNWFRVPLNVVTCLVLLWLHCEERIGGNRAIFGFCSVLMILSNCAMFYFCRAPTPDQSAFGHG